MREKWKKKRSRRLRRKRRKMRARSSSSPSYTIPLFRLTICRCRISQPRNVAWRTTVQSMPGCHSTQGNALVLMSYRPSCSPKRRGSALFKGPHSIHGHVCFTVFNSFRTNFLSLCTFECETTGVRMDCKIYHIVSCQEEDGHIIDVLLRPSFVH
jgi:hypothetical protein